MTVYAGRKGVVYLAPDGSAAAASVASLNKWSLNRQTDKLDVSSFGDTNKTYVQGLPDLQGDFEGFWNDAESKIFTAANSSSAVRMYLYPSSDAPTKYAYGLAWLDASIDCGVNGAITISGSFVAGSSWGILF